MAEITTRCDFCGVVFAATRFEIGGGPATGLRYPKGAGSDHLAIWCAACGPLHRERA